MSVGARSSEDEDEAVVAAMGPAFGFSPPSRLCVVSSVYIDGISVVNYPPRRYGLPGFANSFLLKSRTSKHVL